VRFVFCGGGPLEQKVHVKAKELQKRAQLSNDSILFTGRISEEDKPHYLASADIAVFPSLSGESFGIVLIEAIASGAGVVLGGNNPGYSSVLQDVPLAIFDPRSPESFAERLHSLISDKVLSEKIAQKERNTISKFDVSVVASQLVKIYEDAVQKRATL
jgi:phosphatidylinositol alpha-mannosyltransferase